MTIRQKNNNNIILYVPFVALVLKSELEES